MHLCKKELPPPIDPKQSHSPHSTYQVPWRFLQSLLKNVLFEMIVTCLAYYK